MKNATLIHVTGTILVIIGAILIMFHTLPILKGNAIVIIGFIVSTIGQSWKVNLLKREIQEFKNTTTS
ncbi:MAG: hypothetical protein Q8M15_11905 [Bacteroidota bacterium]|nr:hypothetical protein [Bacteroidota bacterium]